MSKNLGAMDSQVLGEGETANPKKLVVPCKNGSPSAGYQIGYKIGEYVHIYFYAFTIRNFLPCLVYDNAMRTEDLSL